MSSTASSVAFEARTVRTTWIARVPWYAWTAMLAVTCAAVGLHWDISWHRSIGRDTFWTPAHLLIQFCGVLAGVSSAILILGTTFGQNPKQRSSSVRVFGFYGPLGAFMMAWGGFAMIFSAPFDNWWHEAYGLDVKIVSPPHTVLALGIFGVALGSLTLIAAAMNRAEGERRDTLQGAFLYLMGMIFTLMQVFIMEYLLLVSKHTSFPYKVLAIASPLLLAQAYFATQRRWAATIVAGIYTGTMLLLTAILPLFHAEPKLGPVFQNITYFVPPPFPPMVILPAIALDLLWMRTKVSSKLLLAVMSGLVFTLAMLLADWNMATFILQSTLGQWAFLHRGYIDFGTNVLPTSYYARHAFVQEPLGRFVLGVFEAAGIAALSAGMGMIRGEWMRQVQR